MDKTKSTSKHGRNSIRGSGGTYNSLRDMANIGAVINTHTMLGVPCYIHSIAGPKTLFYLFSPYITCIQMNTSNDSDVEDAQGEGPPGRVVRSSMRRRIALKFSVLQVGHTAGEPVSKTMLQQVERCQ